MGSAKVVFGALLLLASAGLIRPAEAITIGGPGGLKPGEAGKIVATSGGAAFDWTFDWSAFKGAAPTLKLRAITEMFFEKPSVVYSPDWSYNLNFIAFPGEYDGAGYTRFDYDLLAEDHPGNGLATYQMSDYLLTFSGFLPHVERYFAASTDHGGNVPGGWSSLYTVYYEVSPVPLPAAGWLLASALGIVGLRRRNSAV